MKEVNERWKEAGIALAGNPDLEIPCPVFGYENLKIRDIIPGSESEMFERRMYCPDCHAVNYLLMKKKSR